MEQSGAQFAYSLPQPLAEGAKSLDVPTSLVSHGSPALIARNDLGMPVGAASLLTVPVGDGLEDLANEIGWMVDFIRGKGQ